MVSHNKERYRFRVLGNRVLKRIFGPKREELTGGWRKLHNLYSSPRRMGHADNVARMEEI
jgi:hypothetical protein